MAEYDKALLEMLAPTPSREEALARLLREQQQGTLPSYSAPKRYSQPRPYPRRRVSR